MTIEELAEILESQLQPSVASLVHLGAGGQGAVFRASRHGETVAVKLFFPEDDRRRIDRELAFLSKAEHENIVRVIDFADVRVDNKDCVVVIYEFLSGGDLRASIESAEVLDSQRLATIGWQIGAAIEFIWGSHVVHRDIKPENVFVKSEEHYVLGDFGFAAHLDLSTITPANMVVGTRGYRAPEQQAGRRHLTIHADIFSLGMTLYEIAALEHPFSNDQARIGHVLPRALSELRPELEDELTRLIDKMLRARPARRPNSISERFATLCEGV